MQSAKWAGFAALALGLWPAIPASAAPLPAGCTANAAGTSVQCTFSYTGNEQLFLVPPGVTSVDVQAAGASGGSSSVNAGGRGAMVSGSLAVSSGATLYVQVGGTGGGAGGSPRGGFNGGGKGGPDGGAGGGGGASDVRTVSRFSAGTLTSRQVVAAGGGGGAGALCIGNTTTQSGAGGGATMAGDVGALCNDGDPSTNSRTPGGAPGTASAGGASGYAPAESGTLGAGGNVGGTSDGTSTAGGGGGGLYGGGTGGRYTLSTPGDLNSIGSAAGGGGGGSNLVPPGGAADIATGAARVTITYQVPVNPPPPTPTPTPTTSGGPVGQLSKTFNFTGSEQTFTVPSWVTSISVTVVGGSGGSSPDAAGGKAGKVTGQLTVTPGSTLFVEVGGNGQNASAGGQGGFNGGGRGGPDSVARGSAAGGGGGGGASDVRTISRTQANTLESRVAVAAGGGGAASQLCTTDIPADRGGAGGDAAQDGQDGTLCGDNFVLVTRSPGGKAGTATSGGASGYLPDESGSLGTGGSVSDTPDGLKISDSTAGGGGAGLYGGGTGGRALLDIQTVGTSPAGGGGGSNLVPDGGSVTVTPDPPVVIITYPPDSPKTPSPSTTPPTESTITTPGSSTPPPTSSSVPPLARTGANAPLAVIGVALLAAGGLVTWGACRARTSPKSH